MTIELIKGGKKTIYTADFVPGRVFRQVFEAQRLLGKEFDMSDEELDQLVMLVVNAYGKQFTVDEFYDGVDARDMMDKITTTITSIISRVTSGEAGDSNTQQ